MATGGTTRRDHRRARAIARSRTGGAVAAAVDAALAANPAAVADYRAGKAQAIGFLVGQVMKATRRPGQRRRGQGGRPRAARRRATTGRAERVGPLNIVLWLAGIALIGVGYTRARGPWTRYQALKAQDANVARYEVVARRRPRRRRDGCVGGDGRAPPPGADRRRDRDRRRRAGVPRVPAPLTARRPTPGALAGRRSLRHSMAVQRSMTTSRPPSWAIRAASQSRRPSWSHRQRAPAATASRAWGTHSSERRKTSTRSNGPVAATASASVAKAGTPSTSRSLGLTGTHS